MGEMADAMINGDFDFYTGVYLGRGHGMPRTKDKSLDWEKKGFNNKSGQYGGTVNWMIQKGVKGQSKANGVIMNYGNNVLKLKFVSDAEKPSNLYVKHLYQHYYKVCNNIQDNWESFTKWYKETYPPNP
jgi:hypothetical protein